MVAEIRRSTELKAHQQNPKIQNSLGTHFKPHLNFGIHMGWTIEGAIGSESKIDACYLSPHLTVTYRVEKLCEF